LTGAGVGYRSFTEPYFDSCGHLQGCRHFHSRHDREAGKNPPQRTCTSRPGPRPRSGKAARPAKKDRGCRKNCSFALTGALMARNHGGNRNQQRNCTADCC
jgi:hypothetical protein